MIVEDIRAQFISSIDSLTIKTADRWAEKCRRIMPLDNREEPRPFSFKYFPWCREILRTKNCQELVFCKGAQTGITEGVLMNQAFFALDQLHVNVFYALPSLSPDAQDFTTSRLNPAIQMSPYIKNMFTDTDRMGLKRTAYNSLYIRGVRSATQIISVDTAVILADEVDRFPEGSLPLLRKRSAGQMTQNKMLMGCSTPSIEGYGVAAWFEESTKEHFFFKCPHCGRFINFRWPDSLIISADRHNDPKIQDSHYICYECKHRLEQEQKHAFLADGTWVPTVESRIRGFHINELYSSAYQPWEVAIDYLKSLNNPYNEQVFYNDDLGLPHIVNGAKLTEVDLINATDDYRLGQLKNMSGLRTIGIDVGKQLHYVAKLWRIESDNSALINDVATCRFIDIGTTENFKDIDFLIAKVRPHVVVIDANPETREAKALAARYPGRVFICYYGRDAKQKEVNLKPDALSVSVNRTAWLDQTLARYRDGSSKLPANVPIEFKEHLKNLVRVYRKLTDGEDLAEYKHTGPDHYAHADNYAEIALNLCGSLSASDTLAFGPLE